MTWTLFTDEKPPIGVDKYFVTNKGNVGIYKREQRRDGSCYYSVNTDLISGDDYFVSDGDDGKWYCEFWYAWADLPELPELPPKRECPHQPIESIISPEGKIRYTPKHDYKDILHNPDVPNTL